ncbi:hypothetical protein EU805_00175 [Salipiger sp. IMCC34102]|uniref:YraN family protein n=1 Tax=Salipiger sp. IMCC34102 TaxID=2510647 RepID=UPI00101C43CC|nr:YraN family protein [Salipiger sp. IMCC34102]RYH03825.1 hypothetical protein EU805_00175 [Salipiger sp. IMCC34102]
MTTQQVTTARQHRGRSNYHAGVAAEEIVARAYARRGYVLAAQRWRGQSGEVDLILKDGDTVVFVEVKKSRTFDQAMGRITQVQVDRICRAATEFVGSEPRGQLTPMRFDVGLVDGAGDVEIREGVLGGW